MTTFENVQAIKDAIDSYIMIDDGHVMIQAKSIFVEDKMEKINAKPLHRIYLGNHEVFLKLWISTITLLLDGSV